MTDWRRHKLFNSLMGLSGYLQADESFSSGGVDEKSQRKKSSESEL